MRSNRLTRRRLLTGVMAAASAPLLVCAASAQTDWPTRPVKVIVPYPPAGGADTVSRILFQKLSEMWNAQFVIAESADHLGNECWSQERHIAGGHVDGVNFSLQSA